jgi:hypothetical protein
MSLKVKIHTWIEGELKVIWHLFEEIGEALGFVSKVTDAHSVKIYDDKQQLIHSVKAGQPDSTNTYA